MPASPPRRASGAKIGGDKLHWFRSHHGAPTDLKWPAVAKRANSIPGHVAAVYWALLDHASQHQSRGCIEGFDAETVGAFFGFEADEVSRIITALTEKNVISQTHILAWEKRQPKREDDSVKRVARHRKRNVTQCNASVTHGNAPEQNRTDKIQNSGTTAGDVRDVVKNVSQGIKINGNGNSGHGRWSDDNRIQYAINKAIPFLPGRDNEERTLIALAAEDTNDPNHAKAVSAMLKATKKAGVGWVSPERRGRQ